MLTEFLLWWVRQLRASLPAWLGQGTDSADARGFIMAVHRPADGPPCIDLVTRRNRGGGAPMRFRLDPAGLAALRVAAPGQGPVVLRLPPGSLLEQRVALPLAAERDPERALRYEMDRLTPFTADALFWTWSVERRDRAGARLHIRLSLVPRAAWSGVIAVLSEAGLRPKALDAMAADGPRRIALERPQAGRGRWMAVALSACAVLAAAATVIPFVRQGIASARVERRIAAVRPQVDRAEALRRQITASGAGTDVFSDQRARVGDVLATLAKVTDLLPDDTFLTELTLRARMLTVVGQSNAAARLLTALASEPTIRNPAFAAPVTRNESARADGFSIRAEVVPMAGP